MSKITIGAMESGKSGRLVKSLRFSGHDSCVGRRAGGLSKMAAPPKHPGFSMCGHAHATRFPARLRARACPRHRSISASKQAHHLQHSTNNLDIRSLSTDTLTTHSTRSPLAVKVAAGKAERSASKAHASAGHTVSRKGCHSVSHDASSPRSALALVLAWVVSFEK